MKYLKTVFIFSLAILGALNWALAQEKPVQEIQVIGEFFGQPIPAQNYFFVKSVLLSFGNRLGLNPQNEEELDGYVWDYLLLSYEAFLNNIVASAEEISAETKQLLKEKTNHTTAVFENQVRFIVEVGKLRQSIINNFSVTASDEEALAQFQDEHNCLSLEIAGFLKEEDAAGFFEKVKQDPKLWEEQKGKYPDSFKLYTLADLNLLMSELGINRDVLYKMLEVESGGIYPPLQIVRGFAVFKILNKKLAQEAEYAKLKYRYLEQIKERKRNQGFEEWLGRVKQKAKIKIYRRGG